MIIFINILWTSALALTVLSCDGFLDTPPVDRLTSDGFYQTQEQSEQGIIGVYADLRQVANCSYWFMSECRSDIMWVEPNPDAYREYSEIGTFRALENTTMFNTTWNTWYKIIYDANIAISKIPGGSFDSEEIRVQFLNEAYFLRGWAYFELARLFGNIPVVDKPMSPAEIKSVKQSSAIDVINNIVIPDLKNAENLPYKEDMQDAKGKKGIEKQGRADKMAAKAMLARVYMTLAGYPYNDVAAKSLAKTQLESVLNDSHAAGYWAPDLEKWRMQWMPSEDCYNKYSIFAIQYRSGGSGNPAVFNTIAVKDLPQTWTKWVCSANKIFIDKTLMHEFDRTYSVSGKKDGRGYDFGVLASIPAEGSVNAYQSKQEMMTFEDGSSDMVYTEAMLYKFLPSKPKLQMMNTVYDETSMKNYDDWGVNLPIIRIEDMQLMYAELLAGEGNIADAMKIVNKIRTRVNCDPRDEAAVDVNNAMNYIKLERKLELMGEGIRWFDQVRYGSWKSDAEAQFDRYSYSELKSNLQDGRHYYPIPRNQLNVTPGLYEQNEGYRE